jgi:transposase InsO family protein
MEEKFVLNCISREISKLSKIEKSKLIIHSDQGVHFTSGAYVKKLSDFEISGSHSRKGNC